MIQIEQGQPIFLLVFIKTAAAGKLQTTAVNNNLLSINLRQ